MKHRCKQRARLEQLQSPHGQAAYVYYSEWMKLNRRTVPSIETFSGSSFYPTFIKFADWAAKHHLPSASGFIRVMVENGNNQPALWCRDSAYALYLQSYESSISPTQQFIRTIDEILLLSQELKCAPRDVFKAIGVDALVDLVQKRKVSPWFFISSSAFRSWWLSLSPSDMQKIENVAQAGALAIRISQSEQLRRTLTEFAKAGRELGL